MARTLTVALVLLLLASQRHAQAACPTGPPGNAAITIACPLNRCPNGPLTFTFVPVPHGQIFGFPPDPGYTIQPCDAITWDFGDGSAPVTVNGASQITHDYTLPESYTATAVVTNALGSGTYSIYFLAATSPAVISFASPVITVMETVGSVTVTVRRSLDLSRTTVVWVLTEGDGPGLVETASRNLTFAPDETEKSFTISIHDDKRYEGTRAYYLTAAVTRGGGFVDSGAKLVVQDDEPPPTLSFDNVRVKEGDSGFFLAYVPLHLSAPLGYQKYITFAVKLLSPASATSEDIDEFADVLISPGQTNALVALYVRGDRIPEPDKQFQLIPDVVAGSGDDPLFVGPAIVTVVNDDATLTPNAPHMAPGELEVLHLDVGNPVVAATTVSAILSTPDVLSVDPVTFPAGSATADVVVHALVPGESSIEVPFPDGRDGTRARAVVSVLPHALLTTPGSLSLPNGGQKTFTITILPPVSTPQLVTFAASDPSVAQLPETVIIPPAGSATVPVTGLRVGDTNVLATWTSPGDGAAITIAVSVIAPGGPPAGHGLLVATPDSLSLPNGEQRTFTIAISPPQSTPQIVALVASDPSVAQLPGTVIIPPAGSATVPVRGLRPGGANVVATWMSPSDGVAVKITVNVVVVNAVRRRAASP